MGKDLRVGIIGASAARGWAKDSHVPAVQHLSGLTLEAVATGNHVSADAAARAFGARTGHGSAAALLNDPSIDLVTIAVKVPDHRALVLAAIAAGKHIYCEWPLGRNGAEAAELAEAARAAGVHAAIGLQARMNPAVRRARDLVASGAIGRVLGARVLSTTMAFGPGVEPGLAFAEEAANGVTLPTIQGAHTIDCVIAMLGRLDAAGALVTTQFPLVQVGDDPVRRVRSTPDHMLLQGRLASGAPVSIEVAGGRPVGATPFSVEITGEAGSLRLEGGAARGFQSGRLRLLHDGKEQACDEGELAGLPDAAINVAGVYAVLRDDIARDRFSVPGFEHALRLTRLMDDMLASSATGTRTTANDWPDSSRADRAGGDRPA